MKPDHICKNCTFYAEPTAECRVEAPKIIPGLLTTAGIQDWHGYFPERGPHSWCGQFEKDHERS